MANPSRLSDLSREFVSANPDNAGRVIAGLLGYNPGPGIYSRLERAIEAMPANVRVQEIPGLIKRYKEGVPGWELREVDLDSVIAGRDVVPRDELLRQVKERSPVYTHKEVVLSDDVPVIQERGYAPVPGGGGLTYMADRVLDYQDEASRLGEGRAHGDPKYATYGQGGDRYTEILLTQPGARAGEYGNHWRRAATSSTDAAEDAVAHARFDTHGDALRINELQSDLGIHNRKAREAASEPSLPPPQQLPSETDEEYVARVIEAGWRVDYRPDGDFVVSGEPGQRELPFPLEDAWSDLLIKRLALEAARKGHRAIEIASPRAIADKVGGNIENYQHAYGKVAKGALERLGRKMGGLVEDAAPQSQAAFTGEASVPGYGAIADQTDFFTGPAVEARKVLRSLEPSGPAPAFARAPQAQFSVLVNAVADGPEHVGAAGTLLQAAIASQLRRSGLSAAEASAAAGQHMPLLVRLAEEQSAAYAAHKRLRDLGDVQDAARKAIPQSSSPPPIYRGVMSDEMRRRLIEQGVGASVLAPLLMTGEDR
jgi:hypothetical protein